jgi:glutamate synthase (NADPH) small chain
MPAEKKKLDLRRREMPKQPAEVRRYNFNEVATGYSDDDAVAEAQRCIQCRDAQCIGKCPVEIDIPAFIRCVAERNFAEGIRILKQKNCLPAVCGRVCPQEEQCESACALKKRNGELAIGRIERFLADWEAAQDGGTLPGIPPFTGRKVAVIGGGPAGLTVAGDLIRLGHSVTVFEALHRMGGVLVYGIPNSVFRKPSSSGKLHTFALLASSASLTLLSARRGPLIRFSKNMTPCLLDQGRDFPGSWISRVKT